MIYGVPNSGGASVMKYVGYRELCSVHRHAKVLRISHYLQKFVKFFAGGSFVGRMADQVYVAAHSFGRYKNIGLTQVFSGFDERFDELWSRIGSPQQALTVRDQRFLQWRYQECPLRQYKTMGLLSNDESRLLGYLIYYVENHSAICADLLVSNGPEDLVSLLSSWAALAWSDGLAALSVSCSDSTLGKLWCARASLDDRLSRLANQTDRSGASRLRPSLFTNASLLRSLPSQMAGISQKETRIY